MTDDTMSAAPTWYSKTFSQWDAESGKIAAWLNELERMPDVEVVGEVAVTPAVIPGADDGLWLFVLAMVLWKENRP